MSLKTKVKQLVKHQETFSAASDQQKVHYDPISKSMSSRTGLSLLTMTNCEMALEEGYYSAKWLNQLVNAMGADESTVVGKNKIGFKSSSGTVFSKIDKIVDTTVTDYNSLLEGKEEIDFSVETDRLREILMIADNYLDAKSLNSDLLFYSGLILAHDTFSLCKAQLALLEPNDVPDPTYQGLDAHLTPNCCPIIREFIKDEDCETLGMSVTAKTLKVTLSNGDVLVLVVKKAMGNMASALSQLIKKECDEGSKFDFSYPVLTDAVRLSNTLAVGDYPTLKKKADLYTTVNGDFDLTIEQDFTCDFSISSRRLATALKYENPNIVFTLKDDVAQTACVTYNQLGVAIMIKTVLY
jgi:hypothetical protein